MSYFNDRFPKPTDKNSSARMPCKALETGQCVDEVITEFESRVPICLSHTTRRKIMKCAIVLAGVLAATPVLASPIGPPIHAGGSLGDSTLRADPPIVVGPDPSQGNFRATFMDYKGAVDVLVDVSSIPDPTQYTLRVFPSLVVLVNGNQRYSVEFTDLLNGDNDTKAVSVGENDIRIPFEFRTPLPIDQALGKITLSATVGETVRAASCCTIDSVNAFANGFVDVTFVDPPASVLEPSSGLVLLTGLLGLSGVALRRAGTSSSR